MEVEKRSSKGGFLQLFDWNVKSRKKLFPNKSELHEGWKQGKENFDCSSVSQLQQVHEDAHGPSLRVGSHYNCAPSGSGDEGCGTRAPGVVARLMGLDSLPSSGSSKPYPIRFYNSHSFRGSQPLKGTTHFESEHHFIDHGDMSYKLDKPLSNSLELGLQKVLNQPIDRFQNEALPPKSARSIPITHHSLLSPIKSPRFIPTRNAAYIMEAAAKIIEQSPQVSTKGKMHFYSSVPLRIQNLKEKMEVARKVSRLPQASQRPKEQSSLQHVKGQHHERNQGLSEDAQVLKGSPASRIGSLENFKNKRKSTSLAVQAKVNVQRKDGLTSSANRSSMNQKVDNSVKLNRIDKKQPKQTNTKKRTSTGRTLDVLQQDNQKQNCTSNKERMSLKCMVVDQQERKAQLTNGSLRPTKTVNKIEVTSMIGTGRTSFTAITEKEISSSKVKKISGKKRSVNGGTLVDGSLVNNILVKKTERSAKYNPAIDECTNCDLGDQDNGMNVVSFTFTSPIKKSVSESNSPHHAIESSDSLCFHNQSGSNKSSLSSLGLNVIGGDALNVLLEQKLRELTCRLETSHHDLDNSDSASCSASSLQASICTLNGSNTMCMENDKEFQDCLHEDKLDVQYHLECSSVDSLLPEEEQKSQVSKEMEECRSCKNGEYEKELGYQYASEISSLEPSFSEESCNSSDCKASFSSSGAKQCLIPEAYEMVNWISAMKPRSVDGETELTDSASSIFAGTNIAAALDFTKFECSYNWVLEYIRCMLGSGELMLIEFALGQISNVITPNLFDELENQKAQSEKNINEQCKLGRKVLFDCVNECLEFRCKWIFVGICKAWTKTMTLFWKESLAEELCNEISNFASMEDLIVDELADKDMSSWYGKWVHFEIETFEEGVEIQERILNALVEEFVADLLSI